MRSDLYLSLTTSVVMSNTQGKCVRHLLVKDAHPIRAAWRGVDVSVFPTSQPQPARCSSSSSLPVSWSSTPPPSPLRPSTIPRTFSSEPRGRQSREMTVNMLCKSSDASFPGPVSHYNTNPSGLVILVVPMARSLSCC